jgi:adenylate cyclase
MPAIDGIKPMTAESRLFSHATERSLRLWSGIIMLVFATSHFLNHAVGLFGVAAMSEVQLWRVAIWRSQPGTILLGGACLVHVLLVFKSTFRRRTLKLPVNEAFHILLGLAIPFFLVQHVVGTRIMSTFAGTDDSYAQMLRFLWPGHALWQSATMLIVWGHGMAGLYFAYRARPWFRQFQTVLLVFAVVIPLLALAGFVSAGREAGTLTLPPEVWTAAQTEVYARASRGGQFVVWGLIAVLLAGIALRFIWQRYRPGVAVTYAGHGEVASPSGLSVLEMSRMHAIPHPSTCGGRGRCASCRVLVLGGLDTLPAPTGLEQRMLERIRAPQQVRLGCQIRPTHDLKLRILLPTETKAFGRELNVSELEWGQEQEVTILFADIRGFSALARNQLPSDLVVVLNHVIDEMCQATLAHGGRVSMVETDGIMAVFGLGQRSRVGARDAIKAAAAMLKSTARTNRELGVAVPQPVRIGVGVHTGHVVVTRIGDAERGYQLTVIGEAVVAAHRLEDATKEFSADCLISANTLDVAGIKAAGQPAYPIHYKNGEVPVQAVVFADRHELKQVLRGDAGTDKPGNDKLGNDKPGVDKAHDDTSDKDTPDPAVTGRA